MFVHKEEVRRRRWPQDVQAMHRSMQCSMFLLIHSKYKNTSGIKNQYQQYTQWRNDGEPFPFSVVLHLHCCCCCLWTAYILLYLSLVVHYYYYSLCRLQLYFLLVVVVMINHILILFVVIWTPVEIDIVPSSSIYCCSNKSYL